MRDRDLDSLVFFVSFFGSAFMIIVFAQIAQSHFGCHGDTLTIINAFLFFDKFNCIDDSYSGRSLISCCTVIVTDCIVEGTVRKV